MYLFHCIYFCFVLSFDILFKKKVGYSKDSPFTDQENNTRSSACIQTSNRASLFNKSDVYSVRAEKDGWIKQFNYKETTSLKQWMYRDSRFQIFLCLSWREKFTSKWKLSCIYAQSCLSNLFLFFFFFSVFEKVILVWNDIGVSKLWHLHKNGISFLNELFLLFGHLDILCWNELSSVYCSCTTKLSCYVPRKTKKCRRWWLF